MNRCDLIMDLFARCGHSEYGDEPVTQLEHALQCAMLAQAEGAAESLVVAALLHDVGHLLHDLPDDAPDHGIDDAHEVLGYTYLRDWFSPAVSDPVRLHVPAKRYLCAVESRYFDELSPASRTSLELQGGAMTTAEVAAFEALPHSEDAVRLRRWDDKAKVPGLTTPPLCEYEPLLARMIQPGADA